MYTIDTGLYTLGISGFGHRLATTVSRPAPLDLVPCYYMYIAFCGARCRVCVSRPVRHVQSQYRSDIPFYTAHAPSMYSIHHNDHHHTHYRLGTCVADGAVAVTGDVIRRWRLQRIQRSRIIDWLRGGGERGGEGPRPRCLGVQQPLRPSRCVNLTPLLVGATASRSSCARPAASQSR